MKRPLALLSLLAVLQTPVIAKDIKPEYRALEVSDVVRTIAEYDVHKMAVPPTFDSLGGWNMYYGVTDMSDKTMDLNKMLNPDYMYLTILHEMRHTLNDRLGLNNKEEWVREYACKDYKLFFKKECPDQNNLDKSIRWEYR